MKIVWDEPKRMANLAKHGLDFASVTVAVFDGAVVQPTRDGRFRVLGRLDGTVVAIIVAPLGVEAVSIISLRRASTKERRLL